MRRAGYFRNRRLDRLLSRASLVVFDMNGLIVDDERAQLEAVNLSLEGFGIGVDEEYWIRRCLGKRTDHFFALLLEENGVPPDEATVRRLVELKNGYYRRRVETSVKSLVRPGVSSLLDFVESNPSQSAAVATSALPAEIDTILGPGGLDWRGRFEHILTGTDITRTKPDPEIYLLLAERAGVEPAECLVFEDSGVGVEAARGAGMECVAVPNGFTVSHDFRGASAVADSMRPDARVLRNRR